MSGALHGDESAFRDRFRLSARFFARKDAVVRPSEEDRLGNGDLGEVRNEILATAVIFDMKLPDLGRDPSGPRGPRRQLRPLRLSWLARVQD